MKPYFETELGKLYHGDCLEVMPRLEPVDLVLTDPPYGIDYQSARRTDKLLWKPKTINDTKPFTDWLKIIPNHLRNGGRLICFYRWDMQEIFKKKIELSGLTIKSQIIWDKIIHGMGDLSGEYAPQHENIFYAVKGNYKFNGKRPKTILRYMRVLPEKLLHPNEKPVGLMQDFILSLTNKKSFITDCFLGSGTTAIACERLNRKWIGIEIEEKYCEIAAKRIESERAQLKLFR